MSSLIENALEERSSNEKWPVDNHVITWIMRFDLLPYRNIS